MAGVDRDTEAGKTSAAEIVGSVDDLLLEIFRRVHDDQSNPQLIKLASKHLNSQASKYCSRIRLRLVSRHWKSLISNNFLLPKPFPAAGLFFECGGPRSMDTTKAHSSYTILLDKSISTARFRETNPPHDPWDGRSKVVHSCNGLLLCASKWTYRAYSVCNPTTGKHSTLPPVPGVDDQIIRGAYLAFDPCKSPHYKVVCVQSCLELGFDNHQFVVYSSETGYWGKCGELFKTNIFSFGKNNNNNNNGVYWNGAIHWVGSSQLVSFNPDDDGDRLAPKVMAMPIARNHQHYYFGESYGHLHYIGLNKGERAVVVHELSSDYSGWVVKYKIDVRHAYGYDYFNVYAVVRGERDEDMFLVLGTNSLKQGRRKIIRFNHHGKTFETIYDFSGPKNPLEDPKELHPFQYIESLACV